MLKIWFSLSYRFPLTCAVFTQTTIGGLYGLLEDILALLPQDEIFILFFEKLDSSIEFSNMVESIGSQEFGMKFDSLKVRLQKHCIMHPTRRRLQLKIKFHAIKISNTYFLNRNFQKSSELRKLLSELQKHKIDVKKIIELFQSFFLFGTF